MSSPSVLSHRAVALKPSLTLAISARAQALKEAGRDICSLSAGEPDFDTPEFIVEATVKALRDGITRYGPAAGDPQLRRAIARKLSSENRVPTDAAQVLVTNGGKQAIYNLFQVLLNPGDQVLIPSPYWLSYPEMARLAGAEPVVLPSSAATGFQLDLEALDAVLTPRSRLLVLNTPSNPTGRVMQRAELEALAAWLRRHPDLLVMCDEIYEFLLAEGETHHSLAALAPDLAERIFIVNGFAKGWAMTGWRLGYLAGRAEVITQLRQCDGGELHRTPSADDCGIAGDRWADAGAAAGCLLCLSPASGRHHRVRGVLPSGPGRGGSGVGAR